MTSKVMLKENILLRCRKQSCTERDNDRAIPSVCPYVKSCGIAAKRLLVTSPKGHWSEGFMVAIRKLGSPQISQICCRTTLLYLYPYTIIII